MSVFMAYNKSMFSFIVIIIYRSLINRICLEYMFLSPPSIIKNNLSFIKYENQGEFGSKKILYKLFDFFLTVWNIFINL